MTKIHTFRKVPIICEKCKNNIPYLISYEMGKKFKCPECHSFVDFDKCYKIEDNKTPEQISNESNKSVSS